MARKTQERGPMKKEDELCLQKYIFKIERTIEANDLTGLMFTKHIIDLDDMDAIQAGDTRIQRARRFLNIISMRGPKAFQAFVESLNSMGYRELAAKLKGCRTTTGELTASVEDSHGANNLSEDVSTLRRRVDDIEQTRATEVDLGVLRSEVKGELHNLSSTLNKIEELSRVSKETENTINSLQKQLKEKDQLLSVAKAQIKALEFKVSKLENENSELRGRMEQQDKQIHSLKSDVEKNKQDADVQRDQDRKDIDELKKVVQHLKDVAPRRRGARVPNSKKKTTIVPKNRFQ